jgi:hypothetical protein
MIYLMLYDSRLKSPARKRHGGSVYVHRLYVDFRVAPHINLQAGDAQAPFGLRCLTPSGYDPWIPQHARNTLRIGTARIHNDQPEELTYLIGSQAHPLIRPHRDHHAACQVPYAFIYLINGPRNLSEHTAAVRLDG